MAATASVTNSTDRLPPEMAMAGDSSVTEIPDFVAASSTSTLIYAATIFILFGTYFQVYPKPVQKVLSNIRIILEDICLVLLSAVFLLSVAVPSGALMVWRIVIHIYLKCKYGYLGGLVEPLDVVGALDTPNSRQVIKAFKVLEGTCDLQSLRERCLKTVGKTSETTGQLVYPKFYQELSKLGGFFCWIPSNFDITYHVRFVEGLNLCSPSQNETQVLERISEICNDEFKPGRSNWEILVVPKFHYDHEVPGSGNTPKKFGIIIRIHHSIGDGYSLLKLILKDMAGERRMSAVPEDTRPSMPLWKGTLVFLYMTLKTPRATIKQLFIQDKNPLHNANKKTSGRKSLVWSQPISVAFLKETKNKMGSGMSTVLLTALAGALRKYMLKEFGETPEHLTVVLPMPAPNHPDDKMTNKFSIVLFPLDSMSSDPVVTNKRIEATGKELARSPVAIANFFLMAVGGVLPASLMRFFLTNSQSTAIVSNLPGPIREISIWGHKLLGTMFWLPSLGDSGLSVSFLSYSNYMRIGLTIDSGVIEQGHAGAQCLIQGITDELMNMARNVGLSVAADEENNYLIADTKPEDKAEGRFEDKCPLIQDYDYENRKNNMTSSLSLRPGFEIMEKVPDSCKSDIVRTKSLSRLTKC